MDIGSAEQHAVLQQFITLCERDERIVAAFLGGSIAAGTADEWSDLDIYLITTDAAYEDFIAGLPAFVHRLGRAVFLENFDRPDQLFFIFMDGTEGELRAGRESRFLDIHAGSYKVLVDKKGLLEGVMFRGDQPTQDAQVETVRRQLYSFWHDLSHFVTALGRGQLWWAQGQLEALRSCGLSLARLRRNSADTNAGQEPYFKVEQVIPGSELAPLETSVGSREPDALLQSAFAIVAFYQQLAPQLAASHGIAYPADLEQLMLTRLERLRQTGGSKP